MEVYAAAFLIVIAIVEVIRILGGDEGSGKVLSYGSEELEELSI